MQFARTEEVAQGLRFAQDDKPKFVRHTYGFAAAGAGAAAAGAADSDTTSIS